MTTVYISGSITGEPGYYEKFRKKEETLKKAGYSVINPARVCASLADTFGHSQLMELCLFMLGEADAIYMLGGWRKSAGASMEYGFAKGRGIPICGAKE